MNWFSDLVGKLPRGTDLAIWMLGWICIIAIYKGIDGAKEIALALGGGMVGFLTGRITPPSTPILTNGEKQ